MSERALTGIRILDLNARGAIAAFDHPTRGRFRVPGCPVRLSASEAVTTPPLLCGQHTEEVLSGILALSPATVADLRARRVV
jgi:crotonobetainyl-CoA:carnitine CoA-transferase CaiB-like acyl-CoA transferase